MKTFIYILCILVCVSCTPTTVFMNTNVDRSTMPDFQRILVVSKLSVVKPDYLTDYIRHFPEQYQVCVVNAGPLALSNPDSLIADQQRTCQSEVMLTIQPYRTYTVDGVGDDVDTVTEFLLAMSDATTQKTFWKGIARRTTVRQGPAAMAVLQQLRTDGVIRGQIRDVPAPVAAN